MCFWLFLCPPSSPNTLFILLNIWTSANLPFMFVSYQRKLFPMHFCGQNGREKNWIWSAQFWLNLNNNPLMSHCFGHWDVFLILFDAKVFGWIVVRIWESLKCQDSHHKSNLHNANSKIHLQSWPTNCEIMRVLLTFHKEHNLSQFVPWSEHPVFEGDNIVTHCVVTLDDESPESRDTGHCQKFRLNLEFNIEK